MTIALNGRTIVGSSVTKTVWHHTDSDNDGTTTVIAKNDVASFNQWIHANALYCFEFRVKDQ
jgi:hypothetical protein